MSIGIENLRKVLESALGELRNELREGLESSLGPVAKDSTLTSIRDRLDVALTALARLVRWGRDVAPTWVHGGEITAPPADTPLVSRTVAPGRQGFIYGFYIMSPERNSFRINWTSGGTSYSIRIFFPTEGSLHFVDFTPLNEGLPADGGTAITITNVNAGSAGSIYQARLLIAEL